MVEDYVVPRYLVAEYKLPNGKLRYAAYYLHDGKQYNISLSGFHINKEVQLKTTYPVYMYMKHQCDEAIDRHKRHNFKNWLKNVKEYVDKS